MASGFSQNTCRPASSAATVERRVCRGRGGDDDHVDLRVGQQVVHVVDVSASCRLARSVAAAWSRSATAAHGHVGQVGDGVEEERREPAGADQPETERADRRARVIP